MNTKGNHNNYSAEDIQKYLEGKMSAPEMHAFEKAALEDPFLAEALEGYETTEAEKWQPRLLALKQEFAAAQNAKVVYMKPASNRWWKMAAAVFLIGGGTVLTLILTKKNENNNTNEIIIAQNSQPKPEPIPAPAYADSPSTNVGLNKTKVVAVKEKGSVAGESNYTASDMFKADSITNFVYTPAVKPASEEIKDKNPGNINSDDALKKPDENKTNQGNITTNATTNNSRFNNTVSPAPVIGYDVRSAEDVKQKWEADKIQQGRKEPPLNRNFIAQVVATDNSPLPFANISIKSEDFGTYADVKGNFRLISTDSILNVEVKSVGYQPQYFTLRSGVPQNKIILAEKQNDRFNDNNLAKKITPVNTIRRSNLLRDSVENVEPADGWDNYDTYVRNNIELPDDVTKKNIHGEVEVSFDVNNSGAITNIRIDKSLCTECDEAAKKLIEQGPRWKLKDGKKGKAKVKVQF